MAARERSTYRSCDLAKVRDYLTVKEAAEFLGVAPNTIRNWDREHKIRARRHPISNYRLFKLADLRRILRLIESSGEYPTGWSSKSRTKPK